MANKPTLKNILAEIKFLNNEVLAEIRGLRKEVNELLDLEVELASELETYRALWKRAEENNDE